MSALARLLDDAQRALVDAAAAVAALDAEVQRLRADAVVVETHVSDCRGCLRSYAVDYLDDDEQCPDCAREYDGRDNDAEHRSDYHASIAGGCV